MLDFESFGDISKLSIWVGNFNFEKELEEYVEEEYDDDDKCSSLFLKRFKIDGLIMIFKKSVFIIDLFPNHKRSSKIVD